MHNIKVNHIYTIYDFELLLEKIKKSDIIYIYFEKMYQNNISEIYYDNYCKIIIIYDKNIIYIINIIFIINIDRKYGVILFKRFLDIINKYEIIKIILDINQINLLNNFINKYDIKNCNRKSKKNYICLNFNQDKNIFRYFINVNIKNIDCYYINLVRCLYYYYNYLCFNNPLLILNIKNMTYKILNDM